ncbi:hypothetical protein CAC01_00300 [Streptomyces sp. CLI2509]|nr:hypothetical protein CAC01_00300 [Streptomyces sp. CLI2509]
MSHRGHTGADAVVHNSAGGKRTRSSALFGDRSPPSWIASRVVHKVPSLGRYSPCIDRRKNPG